MIRDSKFSESKTPLEAYKALVDDFVRIRPGPSEKRVLQKSFWPDLPENSDINTFLGKITEDDRTALIRLLRDARDGGIHDTLVVLEENMVLNELRLVSKKGPLPVDPFGRELFHDWVARREGDDWPAPA